MFKEHRCCSGRGCRLPNLPDFRRFHSQAGLEVCGGSNWPGQASTCLVLGQTGWSAAHSTLQPRSDHTAWLAGQTGQ